MAQIFISYSKHNAEFARYVRGLLHSAGFDVWMDEARLSASEQWTAILEASITACAAFVILVSPEAKESQWVTRELLLAEHLQKPIFPILYSGEIWWNLANIQYEDMRAGLKATVSPRLIDALRAAVDQKSGAQAQTRPTTTASHMTPPTPQTESRKLEAAMPAEAKASEGTEVWAKISLPMSEGLRAELPAVVASGDVIQKDDTRATTFPIRFPVDAATGQRQPAQVEVALTSNDFAVIGDARVALELPPDTDSRTVIFSLEAKAGGRTSGRSRLLIDLFYEGKRIAQISISTLLVVQVTAVPAWTLVSITSAPPGAAESPGNLRGTDMPSAPPSPPIPQAMAKAAADDYMLIDQLPSASAPPLSQPTPPSDFGAGETRSGTLPTSPLPPPRRSSALRTVSLIATLVLVFVVAIVLVTTPKLNSSNSASSTDNQVAFLVTGTQGTPQPTLPSGVEATPVGLPTQFFISGTAPTQQIPPEFASMSVAPLVGCAGSPGASLVQQMSKAGFYATLLDNGITSEDDAHKITNASVIVWGVCSGDVLTLHFELPYAQGANGVSGPLSLTTQTQPEALDQSDSRPVRLAQALTEYASGNSPNYTALAQTFEDLAASATNQSEAAALRTLQQNSAAFARQYNGNSP